MSSRCSDLYVSLEKFHCDNVFVSSRTIYFGGSHPDLNESDSVNSTTVGQIIKNLHFLDTLNHKPITILLNTPGGSWEDGMALYDIIKFTTSKVYIVGLGKVYSMGSVILQAGYQRLLMPNSLVMIHDGTEGYVGNAKSMEAWASNSKKIRQKMYEIYYEHMKKANKNITVGQIEKMCSHDKIFSAEEAIQIGLADKIIGE